MAIADTATIAEVKAGVKDLKALSAYFKGLIKRIQKLDNGAFLIATELASSSMYYAQPYLLQALPAILDGVQKRARLDKKEVQDYTRIVVVDLEFLLNIFKGIEQRSIIFNLIGHFNSILYRH